MSRNYQSTYSAVPTQEPLGCPPQVSGTVPSYQQTNPDLFSGAEQPESAQSRFGILTLITRFSIASILLSLLAIILNSITAANQFYDGYNPGTAAPPTTPFYVADVYVELYPGIWSGILVLFANILLLIYARAVRRTSPPGTCSCDSPLFCGGTALATVFGVLAAGCLVAMGFAGMTTAFLRDLNSCSSLPLLQTTDAQCLCRDDSVWVLTNMPCSITASMFGIYITMVCTLFLLTIINVTISGFFCGFLCCCRGNGYQAINASYSATPIHAPPSGGFIVPAESYVRGNTAPVAQPAFPVASAAPVVKHNY